MTTIYPIHDGVKNVLVRLNDEQLISLMSASLNEGNEDIKVRAVVKSGKIIGLKIVKKGKNEVVKCSWMNESNAKICVRGTTDKTNSGLATEIGDVDGRINLIHYKPVVTDEMIETVEERRMIQRLVEFIVDNGKFIEEGVKFDRIPVINEFKSKFDVENILSIILKSGTENVMDFEWVKLVTCNASKWREYLMKSGYNDEINGKIWRMIYTGEIEKPLKENNKKEEIDVKKLVLEYQKMYVEYYELYHTIDSNFGVKKLINMHNKLEEIRYQIEGTN